MDVPIASCSYPVQAAIGWNNDGVNYLLQAKNTQAALSFSNALTQLKNAVRMEEGPGEVNSSSSKLRAYHCPFIIPSRMEVPSVQELIPRCPHRSIVTDTFQASSPLNQETPPIFRNAFFIEIGDSPVHSSSEHSSRLMSLLCGIILLNIAIVNHIRSFSADPGQSRTIARTLYTMAIENLHPIENNSLSDDDNNDLPMDDRNHFFLRFAVMVALNNALDVADEKDNLQEVFKVHNRLFKPSSTLGSFSWQGQQHGPNVEEQDQAAYREWEVIFQMNATTMKLKSLGFLLNTYTATAA